jgi:hypothetical protein
MTPVLPQCAGRPVVDTDVPRVELPDGRLVTEWALTEAERHLIQRGERIRLELWTGGAAARVRVTITSEHDAT